jgi:hypothetical protein
MPFLLAVVRRQTTVRRMQDRELVAAIVAGDPDGLAEAYDRYAVALYTYCRFMLPDPHPPGAAADAVADTFVVAAAKLQGLRDPDQLGSWLHAVARNECVRQLGPGDPGEPAVAAGGAIAAMPEVNPPVGLRERVLQESANNTPTGRAHRVSVTHRAGQFGPTGFPKPVIPPGPRWWHEVRRHPRVAAAVVTVAATVVVAGIAALLISGGGPHARASTVALGGGDFGTSSAPASPTTSPAGGPSSPSSPSRKPTPATGASSASMSAADTPTTGQSTSPGPARSSSPSRSPSPSPSSSLSPSPSSSPTPGTLTATPSELVLSAVKGKAASGTFILTAVGGPVDFLIHSPDVKVSVSPQSGTLVSAGSWVTITVTVQSLVAFNAHIIVDPGNVNVTVLFSIKA